MASYFLGIDIRIRMASRESGVNKKVVHFGIPSSGSLLKTIKRFLKVTNKARVIMDISRRFFHVYFFLQISMQEGGFNIDPIYVRQQGQEQVGWNSFWLQGQRFYYSQFLKLPLATNRALCLSTLLSDAYLVL
jgi:hypothetical protein